MTDPTPKTEAPDSSRATVAETIYQALMDLSEDAVAIEGQAAAGEPYSALWDALTQSIDAAAALASALRDLESQPPGM